MPDTQAGGASAEASVGDEGAFPAQVHRLDIGCGIKHFLHSGTSLGAFMSNYHYIAGYYLAAKYAVNGILL